jgi:hypothetical protein
MQDNSRMTAKEISEQDNEIPTAHANWLKQSMTQAALRAVQTHEESFVESLIRDVSNPTVTDSEIRQKVVGLKTCWAIRAILNDKASFKLTKQELLTIQ